MPARQRRSRKRFPRAVEKTIYERYEHRCAICGRRTDFDDGVLDHIIPLAKGGSDIAANLQWACYRCNVLKGNRRTNEEVKKILREPSQEGLETKEIVKDLDSKQSIKSLLVEVRENSNICELNQELLEGFAVRGAKYEGPVHKIVPFQHSAWEMSKAEGSVFDYPEKLRDALENLYLEINYENQLIMSSTYLTSGDRAWNLQDRMSDLLPELLQTSERELRKELDRNKTRR